MPPATLSKNQQNDDFKAWKQVLLIDKRQIDSHYKELPKMFSFCSTVTPFNELINKQLKQNEFKALQLEKQEKKVFSKLSALSTSITELKDTLKFYEHTNQYLVKVQNLSERIYDKMEIIKGGMATEFERLLQQQQNLSKDLQLIDHRVEKIVSGEYSQLNEEAHKVPNRNKQNLQTNTIQNRPNSLYKSSKQNEKNISSVKNLTNKTVNDLQQKSLVDEKLEEIQKIKDFIKVTEKQVQDIEAKVKILGKNLNWSEEDHNDFIKIWNRGQGKNYFELQGELVGYFQLYTEEQVRQHMNKYIKFKQLSEEKKEKILAYKQLKEEKKNRQFQILAMEEEKERKKQKKIKANQKNQGQQLQMKAKVDEWKKQKKERQRQAEQKKKQQILRKKQEQQEKKVQEAIAKKQALERWKQEKQEQRLQKMKESQATRKSMTIDRETEQRIRQREEKLIAERMQKAMRKKYEQEEKAQRQQKIKQKKYVKYSYVESKLEEKTTAIKQKERQKFDGKEKKDANTFGGNLLHAGIRATPSWMQGL